MDLVSACAANPTWITWGNKGYTGRMRNLYLAGGCHQVSKASVSIKVVG